MLPVEFLPDVDELPVSWMNRLALANGFIDVNDMLRSYCIIDGKKVVRHLDYFPKVLGLISDNTWSKSILSIYKQDVKDQYDIIPYHNDEHLCVCPECMKEDMTRFGHIVYHFQHQYPGSFTCWKHKCILEYVQPDQRFIQDMNRMEFIPIKGSYDRDTEFKMYSTCYSKGSIFYKIVRYQLEVLMRDKHLTDNEVVEAFRCKGDEEELPMKVVQMIHTKSVDYFTFREQRVLLQLLFDDYPRYVSFFSKIDPVHMIGYRRRKVSNGMFLMTVRNERMLVSDNLLNVNQARTEELEDERILTIAEEEKNKYQMPESNISNMVYESKMMTKVIDLVREIYVEFDSDSIGKATRDVNHRLKPHEVAKQVIAILNEEPWYYVKKKDS